LTEGEVEPSPELESDLGQRSYVPEPKVLVQRDAPRIRGVDTADHAMDFAGSGSRDQLPHNRKSRTVVSRRALHVRLFAKQLLASIVPFDALGARRQARHFLFDTIEEQIERLFCLGMCVYVGRTVRYVHAHDHVGVAASQESAPDGRSARAVRRLNPAARK